jgi:hypothetical protein
VPRITLAVVGPADRVKLEDAITLSDVADVADWPAAVIVTGPVAAPAGITNEILVALAVVMGAVIVPPPC